MFLIIRILYWILIIFLIFPFDYKFASQRQKLIAYFLVFQSYYVQICLTAWFLFWPLKKETQIETQSIDKTIHFKKRTKTKKRLNH